jgi:hypothetical protein
MIHFSDNLKKRLNELRRLTNAEQWAYVRRLNAGSPIKPWPCAMPCSAAPEVVAIGISPGNSPRKEDRGGANTNTSGKRPTFGKPHECFNYQDTKNYWAKVSSLCRHFVRRTEKKMSDANCMALSGHLNLGTGQAGEASVGDTDPAIIHWVAGLLNNYFQPRLIVLFGLNRILKARYDDWNHPNGLQVDWRSPDFEQPFNKYHFRLWKATSAQGKRIGVLMWPNHPSRHPFAGDENGSEWNRALNQASSFLTTHGF